MLEELFVHSLVIQGLNILHGGDSGVNHDVAALHGVNSHLRNLVLGHTHVGQASGDAQVIVQLTQSVAEHLGHEVGAGFLPVMY